MNRMFYPSEKENRNDFAENAGAISIFYVTRLFYKRRFQSYIFCAKIGKEFIRINC